MLFVLMPATTVFAANDSCPSAHDAEYSLREGDTWESIAKRAYCRVGPYDRTQAAVALHQYNRGRVKLITDPLKDGMKICLPPELLGEYYHAERCESDAVCGNGVREGDEACDGTDFGGTTCAALNLPAGRLVCRGDCLGLDASGCLSPPPPPAPSLPVTSPATPPSPISPRSGTPPPTPPSSAERARHVSLDADSAVGVMFPASTPGNPTPYGTIGLARLGARFNVGPVQFIGHAMAGTGGGTTRLDEQDADLHVQLVGAGMQVGIARPVRQVTVMPGIEVQRLFVFHRIDARAPFGPEHLDTRGAMTVLGAFVRVEYRFQRIPRLGAALEWALGYAPEDVEGFPVTTRIQMKTLAGVTYHAF